MCDYQELMISCTMTDMGHMLSKQLRDRVEAGEYKPEPSLVAEAMLRRRGVRELLTAAPTVTQVGRSRVPSETRRQAA